MEALQALLNDLEMIEHQHAELTDTDVRERMHEAIYKGYIAPAAGYELPQDFGLFSDMGNMEVRGSLLRFLHSDEVASACELLATPEERLLSFQNPAVTSDGGRGYDSYFGHADPPQGYADPPQGHADAPHREQPIEPTPPGPAPEPNATTKPWWKVW